LPVHSSGDESEKSREARDFAAWLSSVTNLPIAFYDERYTSTQAEQFLSAAKVSKKQKKQRRDMLAAQIILAAYLESPQRADYNPGSLD
jgi:putative Holliday junction resolvase